MKKYNTQLEQATSERNACGKHYLSLRHELVAMNKHLQHVMLESQQIKQEIHLVEQAKERAWQEV